MKKVYYAGKIKQNDWRHDLFENLRTVELDSVECYKPFLRIGSIEYNGPYFISCDHGCYHGANTHGVGADGNYCSEKGLSKSKALNNCLDEIKSSDVVFAYIESVDCYGTISELGYAKAIGKPIYIVIDRCKLSKSQIDDLWFVLKMAKKTVKSDNIVLAHNDFINWVANNYYLNKEKSNLASDKQIEYIKSLSKQFKYKLITTKNIDATEAKYILDYMTGETKIFHSCMYKYFVVRD